MVLLLNGQEVQFNQSELRALLHDQSCASDVYKFHKKSIQHFENNLNLIYLHQREMAIISVGNNGVCFLGTDDTTTCQFIILDCQNAGLVGAAHLDGCRTDLFFESYINRVKKEIDNFIHLKSLKLNINKSRLDDDEEIEKEEQSKSHFEITVSICGGFLDDKNQSESLSKEILTILTNNYLDMNFRLNLCCIIDFNNVIKRGINFPRYYGFVYNTRIHEMFPATFTENSKEPLSLLRSTRFCCNSTLFNVYNTDLNILELKDFEYNSNSLKNRLYYHKLSQSSDEVLLQYSTSPLQEREGYTNKLRDTFRLMYDHPQPRVTLLDDSNDGSMKFQCHSRTGEWKKLTSP